MHTNNACITSFTETSSNTTCLKKQMFFLEIKEECFSLDINYLRKEQNKTNQSTSTKRKFRVILYHMMPNLIIKDLPSVLILIFADQISNDSLCCSNKYN